jgi:hypothetical protein
MTGSIRRAPARQGKWQRAKRRPPHLRGIRGVRQGPSAAGRTACWLLFGLVAVPGATAQTGSPALQSTVALPAPVVDGTPSRELAVTEADRLLAIFLELLWLEPEGEDVRLVAGDLESAGAWSTPAVRLRQSSSWNYGSDGEIGVGVAIAVPLLDPQGAAQEELLANRLELARHNAAAEHDRRAHEFVRTLRLLAHVEEVVEVVEEHRRSLDVLRPELAGLTLQPATAPLDGQQLGYLELLQSLRRARGERALLWQIVALKTGVAAPSGGPLRLGRPSLTRLDAAEEACREGNEDARRAELVRRQAVAAGAAEAARERTQLSLDLSGDLRYRFASTGVGEPWLADVRLSLRASLPPLAGARSGLTLDARPGGADQVATLDWSGSPAKIRETAGDEADLEQRRSLEEVELGLSRARVARDDATSLVGLRRAALVAAEAALASPGVRVGPADLEALSRARIALLNAELEQDLAVIALAEACGLPPQARTSATSRLRPSIRSTSSSRSPWSSSILPSSLRTNLV